MRLAVITSHPIQYQAPLWRLLAANGVPLHVWFLTNHGLAEANDREFGQRFCWDIDLVGGYTSDFLSVHLPFDMRRFYGISLEENLRLRIKEFGITHLWIEGWRFNAMWQAAHVAKKSSVKLWLRGETNDLKKQTVVKAIVKKIMLKRYFKNFDSFLCIGEANKRFYRSFGVPAGKLVDTPYCVDNDRFATQAKTFRMERDLLRSRWNICPKAKVVLFCGKFIDKKHPMQIVEALATLNERKSLNSQWHGLFVGSGELGDSLRGRCNVIYDYNDSMRVPKAKNTGGEPKASFVGFMNQSEIAKAYVAADVIALPSDFGETWGLVVNEAMSCGVPAVVSDQVGCGDDLPKILNPSSVYKFGDINALSNAIESVVKSAHSASDVMQVVDRCHMRNTVSSVKSLLLGCPS